MSSVVSISQLAKYYQVPEREGGLKASIASLFNRKYKNVKAVDGISFNIGAGEVVGFLGPNGAGKTTTLKMLSGLLHPTSGSVDVLGYEPRHRSHDYLRQITLVMGNRNQLTWDLPALDSFDLQRAVYGIPMDQFKATRDEFIELLELKDLVTKPVRNLSLGERMKMEIVAALLHRPKVLFLDEPTLGLDVTMQRRIRTFIAEYNKRYNATVLLTSHYMADVTALCERIIIIHHGQLKYDGGINDLSRRIAPFKLIGVQLAGSNGHNLAHYGEPVQNEEDSEKQYIQVKAEDVTQVTSRMLTELPIHDITIADPPIEDVIERAFNE